MTLQGAPPQAMPPITILEPPAQVPRPALLLFYLGSFSPTVLLPCILCTVHMQVWCQVVIVNDVLASLSAS